MKGLLKVDDLYYHKLGWAVLHEKEIVGDCYHRLEFALNSWDLDVYDAKDYNVIALDLPLELL